MANENFTEKRYNLFLAELALDGNVTRAANAVGVDRSNAYQRRLRNPTFAQHWDDAIESFADAVEAEAYRRAVTGTTKGIWWQGARVGEEQQWSDSLLLALLKAKRPAQYGDKSKMEVSGADGGPIKTEESPTAIGRKLAFALAVAMRALEQERSAAGEAPGAPGVDPGSGEAMA
jgi:hypothetical protein